MNHNLEPVGLMVDYFDDNLTTGEHTLKVYRCSCGVLVDEHGIEMHSRTATDMVIGENEALVLLISFSAHSTASIEQMAEEAARVVGPRVLVVDSDTVHAVAVPFEEEPDD